MKSVFYAPFLFLQLDFSHFDRPQWKAAFNVQVVLKKRFQENETMNFFLYKDDENVARILEGQ